MSALRAFLAMPFASHFDSLHDNIISTAALTANVELVRLERLPTKAIIQTMAEEIGLSDFLIAVATERNPHVFFEIALAYAAGKQCVILGARGCDFELFAHTYPCFNYTQDAACVRELLVAEFERLKSQSGLATGVVPCRGGSLA